MIVRQFINWVRTAPAGERAEATRALARGWLFSDLSEDDRAAAEGALLMLLDDASPLVRQAMAEVFADAADAPAAIIAALAADQASVALPILEHSPLLIDADLVDIVATGNGDMQSAIARRVDLPASLCAAIAEVGTAAAALELIENPYAAMAPHSLDRIVERHGHLAAIRESLLMRDDLPGATRLALVERLSSTLAHFVTARQWLAPDRAQRVTAEALERSTVNVAAQSRGDDMTALIKHLRATGQLNSGLVLRALLSGNVDLFEEALVELSSLSRTRVSGLLHDRGGVSLNALLSKAGLPESTYPAFRAALDAGHEIGFVSTPDGATRLRRRMVERVLTQCESLPTAAAESLLILLRRFATESAREEARLFCDELAASDDAFADSYDTDEYGFDEYDIVESQLLESDAVDPDSLISGASEITALLACFQDLTEDDDLDATASMASRVDEIFAPKIVDGSVDGDYIEQSDYEFYDRYDRAERSLAA